MRLSEPLTFAVLYVTSSFTAAVQQGRPAVAIIAGADTASVIIGGCKCAQYEAGGPAQRGSDLRWGHDGAGKRVREGEESTAGKGGTPAE